jgi:hypothetical protein
MALKPDDAAMSFLTHGKEQSEAALRIQKDLLDAYEKASTAWLGRVKSEVELWSSLASKLATTQSAPEALEAYQKTVTQRMQMAADDGRRLTEDCQKIMQKMTGLMANGWPKAGG